MAEDMFKNVEFPANMDLRLAAIYAGVGEGRIRTLLREHAIPATKDDSGKWLIAKKDLDAFIATKGTKKAGGTGQHGEGKQWIIRVKYADLQPVKDFLATKGIELLPRYNYAKMQAYQAKRKAAKAAEKAAAPKPVSGAVAQTVPQPLKR